MEVRDLGRMEYGACLALQRSLRDARQRDEIDDVVLLVEHDPVATLGRRGTTADVFDPRLPVHAVERGGKATYHGPGQLVLYPIVRLPEGARDVRAWVEHLQTFVIRLLHHWDIDAHARPDMPGVWTVRSGKKIASVGVAIKRWVSMHGIALNVTLDPAEFQRLDPCGLGAAVMTSMRAEGAAASLADVRAEAARRLVLDGLGGNFPGHRGRVAALLPPQE